MSSGIIITSFETIDVRFPTSRDADGSDAMHPDPDYSAAYIVLHTNKPQLEGHGLTFTIGRGNELCVQACEMLAAKVVGVSLTDITSNFASMWRELTSDTQMRWIGPEKGVIHLATAAVVNAIWDLWAKAQGKPLWQLVNDMGAEQLVSCIDFRYISDVITPEEAVELIQRNDVSRGERLAYLREHGYPAYTTSAGWLGYSDEKIRRLCRDGIAGGWSHFKIKVGADLEDDKRRCRIIREEIGPDRKLMIDANQRWDVDKAIDWVRGLAEFEPWWIEEPTSPDDVLGHAAIARAVAPIGVATGEQCQNRVIFKQLMQANAISFCQIDSCRLGGVNEVLAVLLMAAKMNVPVCPHAGGVGLCEYVNHLIMIDYLRISASLDNRIAEWVDHLHEHFVAPCIERQGAYTLPMTPGYGIEMKRASLEQYQFPNGPAWSNDVMMAGKGVV